MPTIVGILTVMSGKNSILGLSEPAKSWTSRYFYTCEDLKFQTQLNWVRTKFYNLGARCLNSGDSDLSRFADSDLSDSSCCSECISEGTWRGIDVITTSLWRHVPAGNYAYIKFLFSRRENIVENQLNSVLFICVFKMKINNENTN